MNLKQLEAQLQKLIEVHLIRVLPGQKPEDQIVQKLTVALESNTIMQLDGTRLAPNVYTFLVPPDSLDRWKDPHLLETLIEVLTTTSREAGIQFSAPPAISIAEDSKLSAGDFAVIASHRLVMLEETKAQQADTPRAADMVGTGDIPENAFLIVEGTKVFQLRQAVINIGRRLDNTLIVDDPRVSRVHAQLRAINGQYTLFDLRSTGGTFVNGQLANQTVLHPGDVISLGGVSLIYGRDNPLQGPDLGDTAPHIDNGGDGPTNGLHQNRPAPNNNK